MTDEELLLMVLKHHRNFTIEIDANKLVDTTTEHWNFFKNSVKQMCDKDLAVPEATFNRNQIEYYEMDLNWTKDEHSLDIEIFEGRDNTYAYYRNEVTKEYLGFSYRLDKPLPNELLTVFLLFTE